MRGQKMGLAVMAEPPSAAPAASASEAKIEIVLFNGRRVVVPASIDSPVPARLLPDFWKHTIAFPVDANVWIAGGARHAMRHQQTQYPSA